MGYSRDSYYRTKELYEMGGEAALQEISKRKPNRKNRVDPHIEQQAEAIAIDYRAYGQKRASNKLAKRGTNVSAGGVRSIWLSHDLETFKKRLKALETKVAQENLLSTLKMEKYDEGARIPYLIKDENPFYFEGVVSTDQLEKVGKKVRVKQVDIGEFSIQSSDHLEANIIVYDVLGRKINE